MKKIKRLIPLLISTAMLFNCFPVELMAASAEEITAETSEETTVTDIGGLEYQQLSAYPGRDGSESVSLDGLMPSNATLTVQKYSDTESGAICSYDITITKDGEVFQPESEAPITAKITNSKIGKANAANKNMRLWHISDDGIRQEITDFSVEGDTVIFQATGFSLYEIDDGTIPLRTYEFYTPDDSGVYSLYYFPTSSGREICEQTIKGDEKPIFPQLPVLLESRTKTFIGWYVYNEVTGTYDEGIDFSNVPPVTEDSQGVVKVGAVYADCIFVVFHDQRNADGTPGAILATKMVTLTDEVNQFSVDDVTATHDGSTFVQGTEHQEIQAPHMEFKGWSYDYAVNEDPNADRTPLPSVIAVDVENHVGPSHTIDLYPIFEPLRWITFISGATGSGASYIPPCSVEAKNGACSDDIRVPRREGYNFYGWYLREEGHEPVRITDHLADLLESPAFDAEQLEHMHIENGRLIFDHDLKLEAFWTPAQTKYTIICWKQKANYDEDDDYDFETSEQISALTETVVSVPASYQNCPYTGFHYARCDESKEAAGNGTTILNVYYDRNVHTVTFRTTTPSRIIHTVTARYGEDISDIWSFTGSNNVSYPQTNPPTSWKPVGSSTYKERITRMEIMPDENLTFDHTTTSNQTRYFHYYVEALPGAENVRTFRDKGYSLYLDLTHDFNYINYAADFWELKGFTRECAANENNVVVNVGSNTSWNNNTIPNSSLYFYYTRNSYTIEFMDSRDNSLIADISVLYGDNIENYLGGVQLPEAEAGWSFSGWYFDQHCSAKADLDDMTMPAHNMIVYAGWEAEWYLIEIDPNGGQLPEGSSTWFWESYHGDKIVEYIHTTRNYVQDDNGEYYYHLYDRDYYHLSKEWDPAESACTDRRAFYSQELEGADLSRRYRAEDKQMYQYAGWYEVDRETGHETPFNFDQEVDHDILLRLHWKELGAYHIDYHAGDGTIDARDESEDDVFLLLAESVYTGNAKAVVTRSAVAPAGMNFIGWHIRGDKSGRIYPPGHSFELKESYSEITMTEDGTEKRIIIMEAVYIPVDTATVIYDANGGSLKSGMPTAGYEDCMLSYGGRIGVDPERDYENSRPVYSVTNTSVRVSHLLNNSHIKLSGDIFENLNYRFTGWNTKPDGSGIHFEAGANRLIDTAVTAGFDGTPQTLYAEWEVKVYFDKNKLDSNWGGNWEEQDSAYHYDAYNDMYYREVKLNSALHEQPSCTPHCNDPLIVFHYWSAQRYSSGQGSVPEFDFETIITREITLYGYWNSPPEVIVHAVDASDPNLVLKDSEWRKQSAITFTADVPIDIGTESTARVYAEPIPLAGEHYTFDFACISDAFIQTGLNNISDSRSITDIRYDTDARAVKITYSSGTESILPSDQEVYLVFHKRPKDVDIGYVEMQFSGALDEVETIAGAPKTAAVANYVMNNELTTPLDYPVSNDNREYYSFAFGSRNAASAEDLTMITASSNSNSSRPYLEIRNTWRGFEYSLNGTDFVNCGYDIQLYVVYYATQPTIITLSETTAGLPEDILKEFQYTVKITETKTVTTTRYRKSKYGVGNYQQYGSPVVESESPTEYDEQNIDLCDGQSVSFALFYSKIPNNDEEYTEGNYWYRDVIVTEITQNFTVEQTAVPEFETDITSTSSNGTVDAGTLAYSYTTAENSADHTVNYKNTHTPMPLILHVAVAENDGFIARDDLRVSDSSVYTKSIDIGSVYDLTAIDPDTLISDNNRYMFGMIAAADKKPNGELANIEMPVTNLSYQMTAEQDIYQLWLNNDTEKLLDGRDIWLIYYEKPTIRYVIEEPNGRLKLITPVTRNSEAVHLNDVTVEQNSYLPLNAYGTLEFDQTEAGAFKVPPDLDEYDTDHGECWKCFLNYTRIGIGSRTDVRVSDLEEVYSERQLSTGFNDGHMVYRGSPDEEWNNMPSEPVIYVIYRTKGIQMRIRKKVTGDAPDNAEFTVRINSSLIKDMTYLPVSGYSPDGNEVSSVEVGHQTIGGTMTGYVEFKVKDGSDVTVMGLPRGRYLVTEFMPTELYELSATADGYSCTLDEENSFHIIISEDTDIVLNNNVKPVPVTGMKENKVPYMILSAVFLTGSAWLMYIHIRRKKSYEDI
ncbi:InlB B-repeat-containing protein [Ruminococcus albus]|uniref:Repeat domain (List_Bact_rpt) n=1 Tax=Ruminococcus albus TaxID=1264 RepID=A0A1I1LVY9_RUMAL|nr:InlB B-repeat-containing protein [Ruminococcus albus]SFC77259.1 repeat domain (List_Bact_rpt) [Ruminococcus albus]